MSSQECRRQYQIRLTCPHGDHEKWIVASGLTLQEVTTRVWDFKCPNHGDQRIIPFQAESKRESSFFDVSA